MRRLILLFLISLSFTALYSQVVFTESFTVILDSSRFKGSISPEIMIRTQKKVLTEIDNLADLTIRLKKTHLTFANRIEFSKYGEELALSGGYVYAEIRNFTDKVLILEYYGQLVFDHPRGLEIKYAGGVNARFRAYAKKNIGIFFGLGPFYEYEKWNYSGVHDILNPEDFDAVESQYLKLSSYISYKHTINSVLNLDLSAYYQSRFDKLFISPRIAASIKLGYQITEHFEILVKYQAMYDFAPVVPVNRWYHRYYTTIALNF